jgi:hypothetical protein
MRLECAETVAQLRHKYDPQNINFEVLGKWISNCLFGSLNNTEYESRPETLYLDCLLDYHPQLLLFSIYKKPKVDLISGKDDGCFYDVSIFAGLHFEQLFGSSNIVQLKNSIWLSPADITDVSNSIREEIHDWCNNIEEIFCALQPI